MDLKAFFRGLLPSALIATDLTPGKAPVGDAVLYRQLREQLIGLQSRNPDIHQKAGYVFPVQE